MPKYKYDEKGKELRKVKGYISGSSKDQYHIKEEFKGEVVDIPVRFPKDLGVEHPFNFDDMEKTYKTIGVVQGGVNKITDSVLGDFSIKTDDEKIRVVISDFIKHANFSTELRTWIKEGFYKGNGFMEIDLKEQKVTVHNANNIYVKRNRKGKVKGYNQWIGDLNGYSRTSKKLISFNPNQIAHLKINKIAGEAYGIGIVYPNERIIENMVLNEEELHKLISRKAGAPIHVKVGVPGEQVNSDDVDEFKERLQFLTNTTEWVTDGNVEMNVVQFGEIGKNITDTLNHDMQSLSFGMEIPIVIWGAGNIPEGLAKVQLEVLQRKIRAIQEEIESIVEEQIFRPLFEEKGLEGDVEFIWNLPGEEEINNRIEKLTKLIENFNVSEPLRRMCELEVARLLNLEDAEKYLTKPEKETEVEKHPKPQPNPNAPPPKPNAPPPKPKPEQQSDKIALEIKRVQSGEMTVREFVNITNKSEDYSDYLVNILRRLRVDKFVYLSALNAAEVAAGKLPSEEIEKLRNILKDGFRKNKTISAVTREIKDSINLKDVIKDEKVITQKELRPNMIARTETVRLANLGLIDKYKEQDIKEVQWVAAVSERTCEECAALDGQVFDINDVAPPPIHVDCRCSLLSVK